MPRPSNTRGNLIRNKQKTTRIRVSLPNITQKLFFRLENIQDDNSKVNFYTGFSSLHMFMVCFNFLGPCVNKLNYWGSTSTENDKKTNKGRPQALSPLNKFFLVLVCVKLGLFEQNLANRFGISQPTVSRIFNTWINFLFFQFKNIPLCPPKELVSLNMPKSFKEKYPCTRIIVDATEIFVEQPAITELQQLTYSKYKSHNTYKGLIGISPSGAVTFVSDFYPGSISDKEPTRKSGLLQLLESNDSVMADRGFDIAEDLTLIGSN